MKHPLFFCLFPAFRHLKLNVRLTLGLWMWISLLFFSACNKKDTTPPGLTLNDPLPTGIYSALDTLYLSGTATDNEALAGLTIQVLNADGGVEKAYSFDLGGLQQNFEEWIVPGDLYTRTGDHDLVFTLFDQAGNTDQQVISIQLTEVPTTLQKVFISVRNGAGEENLFSITPALQMNFEHYEGLNLAFLRADSRNQSLITGSRTSGAFRILNLSSNSAIHQEMITGLPGQDVLADMDMNEDGYYIGLVNAPFLKLYDPGGNELGLPAMNLAGTHLTQLKVDGNMLLAGMETGTGTGNLITVNRINGDGVSYTPFNFPIEGIERAGDQYPVTTHYFYYNDPVNGGWTGQTENGLYLTGNDYQPGSDAIYDSESNEWASAWLLGPPNTPSVFLTAPGETPAQRWVPSGVTNPMSMSLEKVNKRVFIGGQGMLELRNMDGTLVQQWTVNGTVSHITCLYNK